MGQREALIAGGTGLVGAALLRHLLDHPDYSRVTALVRRPLGLHHPKLAERVVNFDQLAPDLFQADDLFCCLGTTMRKAGSQEAFAQVDLAYPLALAHRAKAAGVQQYLIVTSIGASAKSPFFYNRVKGQVEEALRAMEFPALHIFRPSLLLGARAERRPGEALGALIGTAITPAMVGPLRRYRPIPGSHVAKAMYHAAQQGAPGVYLYESDQIAAMARARTTE